jgi:hypothetical protein
MFRGASGWVAALVALTSLAGCTGMSPSRAPSSKEVPVPEMANTSGRPRQVSLMTLEDLVEAGLRMPPDDRGGVDALRAAAQGCEYLFFAEAMARAAREPRDLPEVSRLLQASAEWVGIRRNPAELLSFTRELSHRECCTRANYVGAAIEGWVAGLASGGQQPASREIETRWRMRELSRHADPRIASPAREALRFFPGDDSQDEAAP